VPNLSGHSIQHYHLLEQLGEGGMATVYKAFDTLLERTVAVKVIRAQRELSAELLKRFAREARALARLSHPNIVRVLDYGEHEGLPFLVMEYLPGGTLKERMDQTQGRPVNWQAAARLLVPIASALEAAHKETIIHRDVKPSNILIGADNQPMLTDFGIAKILDGEETTELTATGVGIGTPRYMAPEQGLGLADERADIYALGTIFYELITGRPPYQGDTPLAILLKKSSEPLPRPKSLVPGLPDAVEAILIKALARLPENRYPNMSTFRLALEKPGAPSTDPDATVDDFSQHLPPAPPITEQRSRKWAPGFGGMLALVFLGCLTLGGLALAGVWVVQAYYDSQATTANTPAQTAPAAESPLPPTSAMLPESIATLAEIPFEPTEAPTKSAPLARDGTQLIRILAGEFIMGSDPSDPYFWGAEAPRHAVYLDEYWIYKTEVTNAMYQQCVAAGTCKPPAQNSSRSHANYYSNPIFDNFPVIHITQPDAARYCQWAGGRLPTEAEWEKAARGADGLLFPWGNQEITSASANFCDVNCIEPDPLAFEANFNDGYADVAPVGSFPSGTSPYGALDMGGNVLEWVADWYETSYYDKSPYENPTGPSTGTRYTLRGGSWWSGRDGLRPAARASKSVGYQSDQVGFRCAADSPP